MEFLINLVVFILSLAVLVVIHEFGHFITAKIFKVYVTEFSIGFGPAIYTTKKDGKETRFSIRGVPLGGYCSMVGESLPEFTEEEYNQLSDKDKELVDLYKSVPENRRLDGIAKWKRAIVMVAGVFLNYLLGFVLIIVSNSIADFHYVTSNVITITDENSNAFKAGMTDGLEIDGVKFEIFFADTEKKEENFSLPEWVKYEKVENGVKIYTVGLIDCSYKEDKVENMNNLRFVLMESQLEQFKPMNDKDYITYTFVTKTDSYVLTMNSVKNENQTFNWPSTGITLNYSNHTRKLTPSEVITYSLEDTGEFTTAIYTSLGSLFTKEGIQNVGGIIAMFDISSTMNSRGLSYYLMFWGLISINLAVMNLLPFPGLDGWHFLVIIIESITRKELPKKFKNIMQTIGFVLLIILMLLITGKDIIMKIISA